jgi:hypothetical protein
MTVVPSYASLPQAGTQGTLARLTSGIRGLWIDTGTHWVHLFGGVVDVKADLLLTQIADGF